MRLPYCISRFLCDAEAELERRPLPAMISISMTALVPIECLRYGMPLARACAATLSLSGYKF